jgi:hypothetical protein
VSTKGLRTNMLGSWSLMVSQFTLSRPKGTMGAHPWISSG